MQLVDFSSRALLIAFILYCVSFLGYVVALTGRRWSNRDPEKHLHRWSRLAFIVSVIGFLSQVAYFITRWIGGGHVPTSNMFEFMTFLGMMIMAAFIVIYLIYKQPLLGAFAMPVSIIILAYASVFPTEVQPLIPALKSYWLYIHVTTAATGEAFFAVGFAAGLMYLLRTVNYKAQEGSARKEQWKLELVLLVILMVIGFTVSVFGFKGMNYQAEFTQQPSMAGNGAQPAMQGTVEYTLPPIVKPYNSQLVQMDTFLGMSQPLFEAPFWMKGINAGRKLNTVIWSALSGIVLYLLLRLAVRQPLGAFAGRVLEGIDPEDLDEISYRAIAIGFPIFTLGALIFAMIWAQEAWGRFWGFDPKETWALITWLFYTVYLHLRLSRGWQGKKSSWLSVVGFIVVMFTLVGVNLVIAGLHSYAGV
ncbi:cytochrome c biogenesis protein CcsA [Ferviditalea candida]|uniref:Cytochrome c biogenesis protein CcsA n=1 Tax=Ferviditalea candida TaxID=3108399 RepID=A0ABU5ZJX0_9BACL|nr:cytochrome c biogenesis protein CcsA [Paenibacillaceae bacterium T2]